MEALKCNDVGEYMRLVAAGRGARNPKIQQLLSQVGGPSAGGGLGEP